MTMRTAEVLRKLTGLAALLLLTACAAGSVEEGAEPMPADEPTAAASNPPPFTFRVAGEEFAFAEGALLQTWPVMFGPRGDFARLAVQMPAEQLAPAELAGLADIIQVDVLQAASVPDLTPTLAGAFADWTGREAEPAGSTYKFTITSQRAATGTRVAYVRQWQKALDLHSLAPFQTLPGAPIFVFGLDDKEVTTLIVCEPLPLGYDGPDHCSLRRKLDDEIGYRVLFPQDLLVYWQIFDEAARDFVEKARI
ncbi:hypothetical protein A8950_2120 [Dongia mobilis]|uniref:Lipoprotein n=1 Tax=Dongia mobilis TaxID=578943 RepID=A0A4V3DEY8_9PROT|nr:hypothetical protein [Dongia mobilis]TDQ82298.1 hypothetical protein A8950_2120 [Dongia mobilis]